MMQELISYYTLNSKTIKSYYMFINLIISSYNDTKIKKCHKINLFYKKVPRWELIRHMAAHGHELANWRDGSLIIE